MDHSIGLGRLVACLSVFALSGCSGLVVLDTPTPVPPTAAPAATVPPTKAVTPTAPPAPIATTRPATATPAADPDLSPLFADDFANACVLGRAEDTTVSARCESNAYVMEMKEGGNSNWQTYKAEYGDIAVEVNARMPISAKGAAYGIVVRETSDHGRMYVFSIKPDGRYGFFNYTKPDYAPVIPYTDSSAIKTGSAANKLKIVTQGRQIALYVNDQWLNTVSDVQLLKGQVGLFTESDAAGSRVEYTTLRISAINRPLTLPAGNVPTPAAQSAATPKAATGLSTPVAKGTANLGAITFSPAVQADDTPVGPRKSFPDGITLVYATWAYDGMKDGQTWRTEWSRDGTVLTKLSTSDTWSGGASGTWWVNVYDPEALVAGKWRLALYVDERLAQSGEFTVDKNPAGQPDFGPITFAPDRTDKDQPVNPVPVRKPVIPAGAKQIYAFFDGISVPKGTKFTTQWMLDDTQFAAPTDFSWTQGPSDNNWVKLSNKDGSALDSGVYELRILINGRLVNVSSVTVGG